MSIFELILLSIAICADSFAASIMIGIKEGNKNLRIYLLVATLFATFQSLMPVLGFLLINIFASYLVCIDHYIAFFFLMYLGIGMITNKDEEEYKGIKISALIVLAIAVTIDALAVGITYSVLNVSIILTIMLNFFLTFITSVIGLFLGAKLGNLVKDKVNVVGGLILIIIGFKILLSHLGII